MFKVALVGRPNVGKSSIYNRIIGKKQAITTDVPGTTRDWNEEIVELEGGVFDLADTAGIEKHAKEELKKKVKDQFDQNIESVDLIFFVVDASTGITSEDQSITDYLRKLKKEVSLVVNKTDLAKSQSEITEFYKLGFGKPVQVSAKRKTGTNQIIKAMKEFASETNKVQPHTGLNLTKQKVPAIQVSILGRPNAGKSSFLNKLINEEKFIVSEVPGTTRDVNSTEVAYKNYEIIFLDTAGLRRRGKIGKMPGKNREGIVEKFSADRTKGALEESDIAILIIDATDGITSQDMHVAGFIKDAGKGVIIVVNKWDLADKGFQHSFDEVESFTRLARYKFEFLPYAPLIFVSSQTGKNVQKVLDLILEIKEKREQRIPTAELNNFLTKILYTKPPVSIDKHQVNIKYATQVDTNPPSFVFFANYPEKVHFSYRRYLENRIRENWDFTGTPIKITFKAK